MKEKIRKIHCEERLKKGFDKLPINKIREICGFYEPNKAEDGSIVWDVTTMWEGEGYEAKTQFEAEVISNLEQIKALLLRKEI